MISIHIKVGIYKIHNSNNNVNNNDNINDHKSNTITIMIMILKIYSFIITIFKKLANITIGTMTKATSKSSSNISP